MPPPFRNPAGNAQLGYNRRRAAGPDGETGRRIGLKIRRGQPHAGSIPAPGTTPFAPAASDRTRVARLLMRRTQVRIEAHRQQPQQRPPRLAGAHHTVAVFGQPVFLQPLHRRRSSAKYCSNAMPWRCPSMAPSTSPRHISCWISSARSWSSALNATPRQTGNWPGPPRPPTTAGRADSGCRWHQCG